MKYFIPIIFVITLALYLAHDTDFVIHSTDESYKNDGKKESLEFKGIHGKADVKVASPADTIEKDETEKQEEKLDAESAGSKGGVISNYTSKLVLKNGESKTLSVGDSIQVLEEDFSKAVQDVMQRRNSTLSFQKQEDFDYLIRNSQKAMELGLDINRLECDEIVCLGEIRGSEYQEIEAYLEDLWSQNDTKIHTLLTVPSPEDEDSVRFVISTDSELNSFTMRQ